MESTLKRFKECRDCSADRVPFRRCSLCQVTDVLNASYDMIEKKTELNVFVNNSMLNGTICRIWTGDQMIHVDDLYFFEENFIRTFDDKPMGEKQAIYMFPIGMVDKNTKLIFDGDLFFWHGTLRQVVYRPDKAAYMAKRVHGGSNTPDYFYMHDLENLLDKVEIIGDAYQDKSIISKPN